MVVEYADSDDEYIFKKIESDAIYDKCPKCQKLTVLFYRTTCKCLLYCTIECMMSDCEDHFDNCKKEALNLIQSPNSKMGVVGLSNLGNTCFMNTALQCVSSILEITNYFLKDYYKKDININNPISTKGFIAKRYASLLKNLWYGEQSTYSPNDMKMTIAKFNENVIFL
jgi:ubiquitin C-terminal hydrolase